MDDIKLKVPYWAADIKDEGLIVFIAVLYRINKRYGFEEWYNFHLTDANKIVGNRSKPYKKLFKCCSEFIECANPFNDEVQFKMVKVTNPELVSVTLTNQRHIRVWCYLLGCMNGNLLDENKYASRPPQLTHFINENEHQLFRMYIKHETN